MKAKDKTPLKKPSGIGLAAAAFISFFIFGFSDVLKGTAIPEIIQDSNISYSSGGALIGFTYFGFFCGTLSSVFLLKKNSAPGLLAFSVITACCGLALFSVSSTIILMFVSAFLIGTGGGLIDVTANLTIQMTADKSRIGRRLNQLAFFHGSGAIASPLFAGLVLALTAQWRSIYLAASIITAVLVVIIIFLVNKNRNNPGSISPGGSLLEFNPRIALLGCILFFYMTLEAGISGWIVEYGRSVIGLGEQPALFYLSLFFILLTAGRLLSSFYVDHLGLRRSVMINFIIIFILVLSGAVVRNLFFLIPCSGLFMASIFPTTVALISNELKVSNMRIMGVFFSIAGAGGIFGPWMIGMMANNFSLQTGFSLLIVFSVCAILICTLYRSVTMASRRC